jgi:hypothetical protein
MFTEFSRCDCYSGILFFEVPHESLTFLRDPLLQVTPKAIRLQKKFVDTSRRRTMKHAKKAD